MTKIASWNINSLRKRQDRLFAWLDATKPEIVAILDMLLRTKELVVENAETAIKALTVFARSTADFSDCLIGRADPTQRSVSTGSSRIWIFVSNKGHR